jgi:uncharacterized membrane protein
MTTTKSQKDAREIRCAVCGKLFPSGQTRDARVVRPDLARLILADGIEWDESKRICLDDLRRYRSRYVQFLLEEERGELNRLDRAVVSSFASGSLLAEDVSARATQALSFGDRAADRVAAFGGSWGFILSFSLLIAVWMALNVTAALFRPFDPYPFILLNLVLSCVAAFQAPIIMMSQRRLEAKDRIRAEHDYVVNLKAELEIRQIHDKIDHQLARQWEKLVEIQQIQIDMLEDSQRR